MLIDTGGLVTGIYFFEFGTEEKLFRLRFVKQ
jgi:hypothetical protein